MPRHPRPEPNFARLVTERDLNQIAVSAHALRRFVQRLQPDIPGADHIAEDMARLENIGSGNRPGPQQGQLNRYRDWMTNHVQPVVLDLIRCEGFWTTDRPHWSLSRAPSDGYLQIGGMCGFPLVNNGRQIVLTTCTNPTGVTWDTALAREYTLMPKPHTPYTPQLLRTPSWLTIIVRAWRTRHRHTGLIAAYRAERSTAIEQTRLENERRQTDTDTAQRHWYEQRDRAAELFRARHS